MPASNWRLFTAKRQPIALTFTGSPTWLPYLAPLPATLNSFAMNTRLDWPPFPIPISAQSRQQATAEANRPRKIKDMMAATAGDTYRRSLATRVIQYYLRLIDVPHRLETSPSGPRLHITELGGYLACCAVLPGADKCEISAVDRENNCKGYLFVEMAAPYYTAQVLGFIPVVTVNELPLSYLQPLSAFVEALEKSSQAAPHIRVSDWAKGLTDGWWGLKDLPPALQPAAVRPATAMRSAPAHPFQPTAAQGADAANALIEILATTPDDVVRWQAAEQLIQLADEPTQKQDIQLPAMRIKPLADALNGLCVALLVGIVTKPDGTFLVGCRLYATGSLSALPDDLILQGVEESAAEEVEGCTFCELTPKTHGDPLEYLFTAESGDCFSLCVRYQDKMDTCTFVLPPAALYQAP